MLKSQDFLVLIKLISLQKEKLKRIHYPSLKKSYENFKYSYTDDHELFDLFSVRGLGSSLGVSKTEVSASLRRCIDNNLLILMNSSTNSLISLIDSDWNVNKKALFELIKYAIPYLYPPKQLGLDYGVLTGFAAPVLKDELTSAGTSIYIWPSEYGTAFGQVLEPIYKTVAFASTHDQFVYNCFALIDAYRLGKAREKDIAIKLIEKEILG